MVSSKIVKTVVLLTRSYNFIIFGCVSDPDLVQSCGTAVHTREIGGIMQVYQVG